VLEVGFLGGLGGMVVSTMLVGRFGMFLRGRRVYYSQVYMFPRTTCAAC